MMIGTTAEEEGDESMKITASNFGTVARPKLTLKKIVLSIALLINVVSGCSSVVSNSERYYRDIPRQPIKWDEYLNN